MRLCAYAKLNLSLRVRGRRADGFHEIESLVQTIDLCDVITLELVPSGIEVENDLRLPIDEDLAARAARLLLAEKVDDRGVRIVVHKGIPAGAGLGGGSSDAAAVLRGLDRLTAPLLPPLRLAALAEDLGSDVPLFLTGGLVRVGGRGEKVTGLPTVRQEGFVVLLPPVSSTTKTVYEAFDRTASGTSGAALRLGENDLWPAARACYPELAAYDEAIRALPAVYAGMSGSGAAFFAAFATRQAARRACARLAAALPEAQVASCEPTPVGQTIDEGDG